MTRALILTQPGDIHAYLVAEAVLRKGGDASLWHCSDFPSQTTETVHLAGGVTEVHVEGPEPARPTADDLAFGAVWLRRPYFSLAPCDLHPADQGFADAQCSVFRQGLFEVLHPGALWINPPHAAERAERKIWQLRTAQQLGLAVPETLISNDPGRIRDFIRRQGGQVVYKTLRATCWRQGDSDLATPTSMVTEESLVEDDLLHAVPGIYQALVTKDYELRVTVIGQRLFAAKLRSQETTAGVLDWRLAGEELPVEPCELPPAVQDLCLALVHRLGLVFGCLDLVVDRSGQTIFLENNQQGQFLFVEERTGMPLLDAFSELLLQGRADYTWNPAKVAVRLPEVLDAARARARQSHEDHVPIFDIAVQESELSGETLSRDAT
jgi:hypothetical protein